MTTSHEPRPPASAPAPKKFDFGGGAPDPAPATAAPVPASEPGAIETASAASELTKASPTQKGADPVRPVRAPATASPRAPRAAATSRSEFDYTAGGFESKVKDVGGMISPSLREVLQRALPQWSADNWEALTAQGQTTPTSSGFREALLRLGLKHIEDPEFISLIPPDGRRRNTRASA